MKVELRRRPTLKERIKEQIIYKITDLCAALLNNSNPKKVIKLGILIRKLTFKYGNLDEMQAVNLQLCDWDGMC